MNVVALTLFALVLFKDPQFRVKVAQDIVYRRAPVRSPVTCEKEMTLDLYEPDGGSHPRPAVVALHGGGFITGSSRSNESLSPLCEELASRGYVCASINYRLESDDADGPGETMRERTLAAAIDDTTEAIRWLVRNAATYRIDANRIALAGRSAGANIAQRLAYSPSGRALPIRAILVMSGAMKNEVTTMQARDAPLCIIHGTNDTLVPIDNALALAKCAAEVGVPHEMYFREGKGNGHISNLALEIDGVSLLERVIQFFDRYVASEQPSDVNSAQRSKLRH